MAKAVAEIQENGDSSRNEQTPIPRDGKVYPKDIQLVLAKQGGPTCRATTAHAVLQVFYAGQDLILAQKESWPLRCTSVIESGSTPCNNRAKRIAVRLIATAKVKELITGLLNEDHLVHVL